MDDTPDLFMQFVFDKWDKEKRDNKLDKGQIRDMKAIENGFKIDKVRFNRLKEIVRALHFS